MNQSTLFRSQRVKWITLALLLAAFAALLTTSFALAQSDSKTISYVENETGPVANLAAMDPEEDDFTWKTSGGYDMDYFKVGEDTGVLTFKMPPDFEDPQDNGSNNSYVVEVQATDTEGNISKTFTVTVQVTEVAEMGEVTWMIDGMNLVQFEVGAELIASLTDGDVEGSSKVPSDIDWQWYRSDSMTAMGTAISGEIGDSYTATSDDVGKYLRVVGTYTVGGGDDETAYLVTGYPVLAEREDNNPPEFSSTSVAREVDEGMKGMTVGDPVTATDDGPGQLTYGLGGDDAAKFAIDRKTGQITTKVDLDHEAPAGDDANCATKNECEVTVTAYDSAGDGSEEATVTITIKNVNEAPDFTEGPKTIQTYENRTNLFGTDPDDPNTAASDVTYEAMDPEGGNVNLSLRGDDRLRFELSDDGVLSFKTAPDFEKPTDRDRDNVYKVTVRASDSTERTDRTEHTDRMVTVTVMNVNEAPAVSGDDERNYAENRSDPVFTFTATDPEGDTPINWAVLASNAGIIAANTDDDLEAADAADAEHFTIDKNGVLKFSAPPDFEAPSGEGATSNTYKVVVTACDVALAGDPAACPDNTNLGNPATAKTTVYHEFVVTVTNVPEEATLTLRAGAATGKQLRQFDQGVEVFAVPGITGIDAGYALPDSGATPPDNRPAYAWYRSSSRTALGQRINTAADTPAIGASYTLGSANPDSLDPNPDVNKYIHVVHNYTLGTGADLKMKSVRAVTELRVAAVRTAANPDNDDEPTFDPPTLTRSVNEGAKGLRVGAPVTAKDVAKRALFYELTNTDGTTPLTDGTDGTKFAIDSKTGQITTAVALDREAGAGAAANCAAENSCVVTVTATNSADEDSGATAEESTRATVTITIKDVNEAPDFDNAGSLEKEISHKENQASLHESNDDVEESEVTFTAMDQESLNVTYTLRGADSALFQIDSAQLLSFKAAPDYEMPADRNKDNIYEVTVRASDDSNLHTEHTVKVMVTNVNEAPNITGANPPEEPAPDRDGKVTLSAAPMAGKAVTARLSDPDDPVASSVMWQWSKSMTMGGTFADIDGATSSTYTPMAADEGYYLRATANYDDGHGSGKTASGTTTAAVAAGIPADLAKFDTSGNGGIEKSEVLDAIDGYLDGGEGAPTKQEILDLMDFYFDN